MVAAHEFLVGLHGPLRRRVRLPKSFAAIYGGRFPPGIWLQRDDYPNGPSCVCLEVGDTGRLELTKGWWTFAHAQRLQTDQILLFRYNGQSTLFVTVFDFPGGRAECCLEASSEEESSSCGCEEL